MGSSSPTSRIKDHYFTIKLAVILGISLLFLITSFWVNNTIGERKVLLNKAKNDIASSWAKSQTITGPMLIIPYVDHLKKDELRHMVFLPNRFNINGVVDPEIRRRGIFEVLVYRAELELSCDFQPNKQLQIADKTIHWGQAKIIIAIKDVRGLSSINLKINDADAVVLPGGALTDKFKGVHVPINLASQDGQLNIKLNMTLKGSDSISFVPLAKETGVALNSSWADPSFIGQFLPNTKSITKQGFQAQWSVPSLASGFPERFDEDELNKLFLKNFEVQTLGVRFLKTADHYQQAERVTKYSFLFVLYTFLLFFLYEVVKKVKIHVFQYCLTAASLLCFSILLTAFAEHVPFELAYGVASLAIITQIAFYAFGVLHKKFERVLFVSLLTTLYLYLFIVLRLEEIAFLIGAVGMFVAITAAMYFTKDIKWFEEKAQSQV